MRENELGLGGLLLRFFAGVFDEFAVELFAHESHPLLGGFAFFLLEAAVGHAIDANAPLFAGFLLILGKGESFGIPLTEIELREICDGDFASILGDDGIAIEDHGTSQRAEQKEKSDGGESHQDVTDDPLLADGASVVPFFGRLAIPFHASGERFPCLQMPFLEERCLTEFCRPWGGSLSLRRDQR